jgi:hypothetical protein
MSENTTRIVDLPDNNLQMDNGYMGQPMNRHPPHHHAQTHSPNINFEEVNTTYIPMNVHPNPYGNHIQPEMMPPPEYQTSQLKNDIIPPPEQQTALQNMPQMRLPSRDIPMDQAAYQHDEEIKPNFIPKPKLTGDYVKEYEEASEKAMRKQEKKKQQEEHIDQTLTDVQLPILLAFLFFIFQLPIINAILYKYLKFLPIFHADGNMNIYGTLFKSSLFGSIFFVIQKFINFLLVL